VTIDLYDRLVLGRPKVILAAMAAAFAFFAFWSRDFRLDASSDSIVLEHDEDLRYQRKISARYESGDFVAVTFRPREDLFSDESLSKIRALRAELKALPRVSSVVSLLDVPLLKNPPGTLKELKDNIKTLEDEKADRGLAIAEFRDSPIYQNMLVSPDLKSTAIQVNFAENTAFQGMLEKRSALVEKKLDGDITPLELAELESMDGEYRRYKDAVREERHEDVAAIRAVIARHRGGAELFLGGVPMIVDDIISFIKNDLRLFGLGMLGLLIGALGLIFRRKRWILLPILSCMGSVVTMMGLLGLTGWDVTVVSSNFISLQLIFTMSLAIHITVRYRELLRRTPNKENRALIREAVGATFIPCLYATLTTIAGFASLVFCDILPVVSFGWMMTMGLAVSMVVTFLLLPAGIAMFRKPPAEEEYDFGEKLTGWFARLTEYRPITIFATTAVVLSATMIGCLRLEVENSFIDYFKKTTEIYQGMKFIDRNLGGTTPLDVVLDFGAEPDAASGANAAPAAPAGAAEDDDFAEFDEFEEEAEDPTKYWYTTRKLDRIEKVHDYLDGLSATGKVLSLATLGKTTRSLNEDKPFDDFTLSVLFNSMPEEFQGILIRPYVSIEGNQARITTRIKDSMPELRRDALIKKIRSDLVEKLGLEEGSFRISGLMVLYNNMLQSLFNSQIKTIGFTVLALMSMFLILFRSIKIALIAVLPNLLSSMTVLGVMGIAGIPLDVMTITIVAIAIGIAVDDTIHYLHRFQKEVAIDGNYVGAMHRCHGSIGNAMFYTSLTITTGFSILSLSSFVPSILFGLLTALAMVMALISALSLLPRLILLVKPFGPDASVGEENKMAMSRKKA
jgi:predicted RND superfamily exporter protein